MNFGLLSRPALPLLYAVRCAVILPAPLLHDTFMHWMAQQDRQDNVVLRAENENLKNENYRLQAALRNIVCPNCGGPAMLGEMGYDEQKLRIKNARLKEEFERHCCLVSQCTGRPLQSLGPTPLLPNSLDLEISGYPRKFDQEHMPNCPSDMIPLHFMPEDSHFSANALIMEEEKSLAVELAMSCMDELVQICHTDEPLWIRATETAKEVLNLEDVTWVEHAEVEDGSIHQVFNHQVGSGTSFGAHRWLAVLRRQCQRLASLMARNISDLGGN